MTTLIAKLLIVTDAYRRNTGLSESRVSMLVFGDGKVLTGLTSGGRDITTRRYEGALRWLSERWPMGSPWPEEIERLPEDLSGCDPAVTKTQAGAVS